MGILMGILSVNSMAFDQPVLTERRLGIGRHHGVKNRVEQNKRVAGFTCGATCRARHTGHAAALVKPQVLNQLGGAKSKSAAIQISD